MKRKTPVLDTITRSQVVINFNYTGRNDYKIREEIAACVNRNQWFPQGTWCYNSAEEVVVDYMTKDYSTNSIVRFYINY